MVLPNETVEAYLENQNVWFETCSPRTGVEGQLVARIADTAWRLDRCTRIEHERLRAQIGRDMENSNTWRSVTALKTEVDALRDLSGAARWEASRGETPRPLSLVKELLEKGHLIVGIAQGFGGLADDLLAALKTRLSEMESHANESGATRDDLLAVASATDVLMNRMEAALNSSMAQTELLVKRLSEMVIPDEGDTKKMARYRAELERSHARLLGLLEDIRSGSRRGSKKKRSSFRDGKKTAEFRLRVVR